MIEGRGGAGWGALPKAAALAAAGLSNLALPMIGVANCAAVRIGRAIGQPQKLLETAKPFHLPNPYYRDFGMVGALGLEPRTR
jgi:hypothetical protein